MEQQPRDPPAPPAPSGLHGAVAAACLLAAAAAVLLVAAADGAEATHLRGGALFWEVVEPWNESGAQVGWIVEFQGQINLRASFYGNPAIGVQFACGSIQVVGSVLPGPSYCLEAVHINPQEDWVIGRITAPGGGPVLHSFNTLAMGGPFEAHLGPECCRISNGGTSLPWHHINNPDTNQQLLTTVQLPLALDPNPQPNSSPKAFVPPLYGCHPTGGVCRVPILSWDPDGDPITLRFSTGAEAIGAGGAFDQPAGATLDNVNSELVWDPAGATNPSMCFAAYSVQVMLEDGQTHAPVEWLITVCDRDPPHWVEPPSPCGQTLELPMDQPAVFTLEAAHASPSAVVTKFLSPITPLPDGATHAIPGIPSNPVTTTFNWTPGADDVGRTIPLSYYAYSAGMYAPVCTVTLVVTPPAPIVAFRCQTLSNPLLRIQFTDQTVETLGSVVAWHWNFGDGNTSTQQHPHNDYAEQGFYDVTLTVTDSFGQNVSLTRNCFARDNAPPVMKPIPERFVNVHERIRFQVDGHDPDGDPIVFSVRNPPDGASFDPEARIFVWTPERSGTYHVIFRVEEVDNPGFFGEAVGLIHVLPPPDLPQDRGDADGDGAPDHLSECPSGDCGEPGGAGGNDDSPAPVDGDGDDSPAGPGDPLPADPAEEDGTAAPEPCTVPDPRPRAVFATPEPDGVQVTWDAGADCPGWHHAVWRGQDSDLIGVTHDGSLLDPAPWLDRVQHYWVQAIPPGQAPAFRSDEAVRSGPVDLRACPDLDCGDPDGPGAETRIDPAWRGSTAQAALGGLGVLALLGATTGILLFLARRRRKG